MHQKLWSYSETWHTTEVIVIFHSGLFFALLPCNSPKIENFKKLKKIPEAIIILPKCTKKHDHMLYCCWDMARDKSNYSFSFQAIFCCFFYPLTAPKMKAIAGDIIILVKCIKNHDHMLFCSWDMAHDGCSYFSF